MNKFTNVNSRYHHLPLTVIKYLPSVWHTWWIRKQGTLMLQPPLYLIHTKVKFNYSPVTTNFNILVFSFLSQHRGGNVMYVPHKRHFGMKASILFSFTCCVSLSVQFECSSSVDENWFSGSFLLHVITLIKQVICHF